MAFIPSGLWCQVVSTGGGAILGPVTVLFMRFINDIDVYCSNSETFLYADDS